MKVGSIDKGEIGTSLLARIWQVIAVNFDRQLPTG